MAIITISRKMCSYGDEIAAALSNRLGWQLIDRNVMLSECLSDIATPHEMHMLKESAKFYLEQSKQQCSFLEYMEHQLHQMAKNQSMILLGFGSQVIFADDPNALHFRIIATHIDRNKRVKSMYHMNDDEAEQVLKEADKKRRKFVSTLYKRDVTDMHLYHLAFNTSVLTIDECVSAIIAMQHERDILLEREKVLLDSNIINNDSAIPVLKNESEVEFAKILDMYHIDWQYEPKTFPIEWDAEGNVTSAFSPDFYLTKFDTYIELTTMNQKYVTEKNKKAKKVQKLYPGTRVKIVYKKNFHSIVERLKQL